MGLNAFLKGLLDKIPSQDFKFPQLCYVNIHSWDFHILHNRLYYEIHLNGFNNFPLNFFSQNTIMGFLNSHYCIIKLIYIHGVSAFYKMECVIKHTSMGLIIFLLMVLCRILPWDF